MKIAIWMNIPSHHQADFLDALKQIGVDLVVRYYDPNVLKERQLLGWQQNFSEENGVFIAPSLRALETIPDYKDRVHIIPGYGSRFLLQLAGRLSRESVEWAHWSECSRPGLRWFLGFARKYYYGKLVTRHALGAFAQGILAQDDFVRWGIPIEKIAMLSYAVKRPDSETSSSSYEQGILKDRKSFIYIGSLCRRKSTDILLKSFASIKPIDRRGWLLTLVGPDKSKGYYRKLASRLGIINDILFIDSVPNSHVWDFLKFAKVFVLPSRYDGWGVVLNEAASMGLALIGSDKAGASHHLISPGINGFRVRAGDADSLRSALLAYMHHPELAEKHGDSSLELSKYFTPDRNAQRFLDTIESWQAMK